MAIFGRGIGLKNANENRHQVDNKQCYCHLRQLILKKHDKSMWAAMYFVVNAVSSLAPITMLKIPIYQNNCFAIVVKYDIIKHFAAFGCTLYIVSSKRVKNSRICVFPNATYDVITRCHNNSDSSQALPKCVSGSSC